MKANKLNIFINKPIKEVFNYSLESNNVPKWITFIKEEIPSERPVKVGTKLKNIGINSDTWNEYEVIDFVENRTFTLKRLNGDYFVKYTCTEKGNGTDFEYFEWAENEELADLMQMSALELLKNNIENIMNDKKVVLVTGGTSGIGLGTIEYLLEQGSYEIISLSRGDKNLSLAKEKLGKNTNKITFLQGDISKEESCRKIYEEINEKYSKLDGLVNSAGIIKLGGIEQQTLEEWNNSININLTGMFLLTKTLLPLLKKGKNTSIVNISSMSSERAGGSIAYCASKAGVDMLTKYMGQELGKYNIRVNSVNPAAVYTNIYVASEDYTQEGYDKWSKEKATLYPLGRIGDAKKDIAPTIEFLLSDKSLWTTGSIYLVDGGKSI